MICASCYEEIDSWTPQCPYCGRTTVFQGKYRLEVPLGRRDTGESYAATRLSDERPVVVRFFTREGRSGEQLHSRVEHVLDTLRRIEHPGIPEIVEQVVAHEEQSATAISIEGYIEGRPLHDEVAAHHHQESEVLQIGIELVGLLRELHQAGPVVHGAISLARVLRRPNGGIALVGVDLMPGPTASPFAAPEMHDGRRLPASDLYMVGALMVSLMTRRLPSEMRGSDGRLMWQPHVQCSYGMRTVLRALLEPDSSRRPQHLGQLVEGMGRVAQNPETPLQMEQMSKAQGQDSQREAMRRFRTERNAAIAANLGGDDGSSAVSMRGRGSSGASGGGGSSLLKIILVLLIIGLLAFAYQMMSAQKAVESSASFEGSSSSE